MNGRRFNEADALETQHDVYLRELEEAQDWDRAFNALPWPSCSGNCAQGRRLCVTPQACQLPESPQRRRMYQILDERRARFMDAMTPLFRLFLAAVGLCVAAAVLAAMFAGLGQ